MPHRHTVLIGRPRLGTALRTWRWVAVGVVLTAAGSRGQSNVVTAPVLDAATYQRLVDENLDLRREQTRLTREANDLRRRNASLVLQVQELERKQTALTAALADYRSPEELTAELNRVRKERDTLSREVERIREEARAAGAAAPAAGAPAAGSDLYRKLERDNAELREQLRAALASVQSDNQARLAGSRRETQLAAQVEELNRQLAVQRREVEQAAAHEKLLRTALVKVARKVYAYETTLRETEARRLAQAAATNVVVGTRPRKPEALLDAARKYVAAGRYRDAERLYRSGIERDPTNAPLHYSLGVLYDDYLQKPREAAFHYRRYLALNPGAPDAAIVRSWLLELDVESR